MMGTGLKERALVMLLKATLSESCGLYRRVVTQGIKPDIPGTLLIARVQPCRTFKPPSPATAPRLISWADQSFKLW